MDLPHQTRQIKEKTCTTINSLQEKWNKHKTDTSILLDQSEIKSSKLKDSYDRLHGEFIDAVSENERLKRKLEEERERSRSRSEVKRTNINNNTTPNLTQELTKIKQEVQTLNHDRTKNLAQLKALQNENKKILRDNDLLRSAFHKIDQKANFLENELSDTKSELEIFEEMLKNVKFKEDESGELNRSLSEIGLSFREGKGILGRADFESTRIPLSEKVSVTTALKNLADQHNKNRKVCLDLAEEAKRIKDRDSELYKVLNS